MNFTPKFTERIWDSFDALNFLSQYFIYQNVYSPYFCKKNSLLKEMAKWHKSSFFPYQNSADFKRYSIAVFSNDLLGWKTKIF